MSRKLFIVGIVHNTAEFPVRLAKELAHEAHAKFDNVQCLSFHEPAHTLLLPLVGQRPGMFDNHCLTAQMPWQTTHPQRPRESNEEFRNRRNRTRYATAFIEAIEGLCMALNEDIFRIWVPGEIRRRMENAKEDTRTLLIVTDLRDYRDILLLRQGVDATGSLIVKCVCEDSARLGIKCPELDSSHWESFAKEVTPDSYDCQIDPTQEGCVEFLMERVIRMRE